MKPIRITELGTMGTCEQKWMYRYGDPDAALDDEEGSRAMTLGTLFHAWWGEWHKTPGGYNDIVVPNVLAAIPEDRQASITEDIAADADWMIRRYDQAFIASKDEWRLVANEVELEAIVDGLLLQGRADAIFEHIPTGDLFLGECKTMRDWRRLDTLTVDPQMTHYYMLLRESGYDIKGVLYDAAKSYRWKRDEHKHPPEESFQRVFIDRTEAQCHASLKELHAFNERRTDLVEHTRLPLRNIGQTCSWCWARVRCWDELAFPETVIEVVE